MVVGMSAFQWVMHAETFGIVRNLGTNLVIYAIGGLLFGLWTWHTTERTYARTLNQTGDEDPNKP